MAFVETQDEEELKKQQGLLAPELSGAGGEIAGTGSPNLPSPQSSGSAGFTDINAYLDANREQAAGMGDTMAGRIGQEAQGFKTDVDTKVSGFGADAAKARGEETALAGQVIADPVKVAQDAALRERFLNMRHGQFTGPQAAFSDEELGQFGQRATDLKAKAPDMTSKESAKQYLYGTGKNPTLGQVELDSLLLGQDPTARGKIEAAAEQFKTLQDYLDQAQAGSESQAATFGQQSQEDAKLKTGSKWIPDPNYTGIRGFPGGPGWIKQDTFYPDEFTAQLQKQATDATKTRDDVRADEAAIRKFFTDWYVPTAKNGPWNTFPATPNADQIGMDFASKYGDRASADLNTMGLLDSLTNETISRFSVPAGATVGLNYDQWYKGYNPGSEGTATAWGTATEDQAARLMALQDLMEADYGIAGADADRGAFNVGKVSDPLVTAAMREATYGQPTGGSAANYYANMKKYLRDQLPGDQWFIQGTN